MKTEGISSEMSEDLKKAYLNMAPSQTLKWIESGKNPSEENVEIEGTEPYIVGGHTASGYWVDTKRETTIKGLFAAGDVAGGCPQKYVTGALVEGEIAALEAVRQIKQEQSSIYEFSENDESSLLDKKVLEAEEFLNFDKPLFSIEDLEEAMQKIMDTYAGGISRNYAYNEKQLNIADEKIDEVINLTNKLRAEDMHELMFVYELKERLTVCKSVIAHLRERKETRWHSFAENLDYREKSDEYLKYINSKVIDGKLTVLFRDLVKEGETYEHIN